MPTTPQLSISADGARRFLVRRHLLAPPRALPAEPESVLAVVDRLGSLQFDPLEVPGARSHDLVLHARIAGYRRAWCEQWLYGPERRLIELYNKSLNILPLSELPHHRISWERNRRHYSLTILHDQAKTVSAILDRIRADGPLSTAAFGDHTHAVDWWWAPTRAARAVMEALFVTGVLGIQRREGNRRYYDLIERLVPGKLLARSESEEDAMRHRLLSRFRAVGLLAGSGQGEIVHGTGTTPERARRTSELVGAGLLTAAEVEGMPATRYLLTEELTVLSDTRPVPAAVTFLAPLDPLVWDRRQLRSLFAFDYLWEVYVPAAKRRWGYYVLPILFGDRFVGRIEPRYERSSRRLRILGIWFETGFEPMEEPSFLPALSDAVEAYRSFVAAETITWPRTRSGREIAAALRSLG
ncbi:MAG: winged helix DNA-binding domain-containing protein [Chloroflexota bacterium]|nr:winged helix DNA-binding domain-containing protein [Chloroflexota bacterium]